MLSRQRHAISRTQLGRQKEPNLKTLVFLLSVEFWRHSVLIGGTQRLVLPERRNGSGDRTHNQSIVQSHFVPLRRRSKEYTCRPKFKKPTYEIASFKNDKLRLKMENLGQVSFYSTTIKKCRIRFLYR